MVYQPTIIEPNEWLPNELYTYLYYLPSCFPINELDSCVRIKNIWEEFFHYRVNLWYIRVTVRGISRNKMKKKKKLQRNSKRKLDSLIVENEKKWWKIVCGCNSSRGNKSAQIKASRGEKKKRGKKRNYGLAK